MAASPKRKAGRPPLPAEERADTVNVRLPRATWERLKAAAANMDPKVETPALLDSLVRRGLDSMEGGK